MMPAENPTIVLPDVGANPEFVKLDFEQVLRDGGREVVGTTQELIRDAYDNPVTWLHNGHAQPDDCQSAFLVGRGWSATPDRLRMLDEAGIPWMAVNNYPKDAPKPRYWCTGDPPVYFGERVWNDIEVMKFSPMAAINLPRPRLDAYESPQLTPKDAPNCHYYHHVNNEVSMESWLHTPWLTWGTSIAGFAHGPNGTRTERIVPSQFYKKGAARSSMLVGMRLLWHLGYRCVYLLGCDCTPGHSPYPEYWNTIFHLTDQLANTFRRFCYNVIQTNPDSHLRSFPIIPFQEAMQEAIG